MLLSPQDAELFFKLHQTLLLFVNQRLRVIPDQPASPEEFGALTAEAAAQIRDALVKRTDLIESFVGENPAHLSDEELLIVRSWQHLVHGRFYIFRELSNYTVFLSSAEQPVAYGVLALTQPFEELVGPELPVLVETVLLPFNDRIVYDGVLRSSRIYFGPGIRRSLNESYKKAKARHGIVTSLPMSEYSPPRRNAMAPSKKLPVTGTVYQFKITLKESQPPIWRRIQVKDCTLDQLHQHIQTAMGWTNSHLHDFQVGDQLYGDPELLQENFQEMGYRNSRTTKISKILPKTGKRFRFQYQYDFGDSWYHEVLYEDAVPAEAKAKYPLCLEGERACPPEDCGGVWGYAEFVEAIQNPDNPQHQEMLDWVGGRFDPEAFDPAEATKAMTKGLPDWRSMAGW